MHHLGMATGDLPKLKPEFEVIALALQEASVALSHSDIHQHERSAERHLTAR